MAPYCNHIIASLFNSSLLHGVSKPLQNDYVGLGPMLSGVTSVQGVISRLQCHDMFSQDCWTVPLLSVCGTEQPSMHCRCPSTAHRCLGRQTSELQIRKCNVLGDECEVDVSRQASSRFRERNGTGSEASQDTWHSSPGRIFKQQGR